MSESKHTKCVMTNITQYVYWCVCVCVCVWRGGESFIVFLFQIWRVDSLITSKMSLMSQTSAWVTSCCFHLAASFSFSLMLYELCFGLFGYIVIGGVFIPCIHWIFFFLDIEQFVFILNKIYLIAVNCKQIYLICNHYLVDGRDIRESFENVTN